MRDRAGGVAALHVLAPSSTGGLERVVQMLATEQRRCGTGVRVAAVLEPAPGEHPFFAPLEEADVPVDRVVVPHRSYLREWRILAAVLRAQHPAVVHTHGYHADVLAGSLARRRGIPTVSTVHGFTGGDVKNRFYEFLQVRSYRRFRAIVAVSQPVAARLSAAGVSGRRLHVIQNAWADRTPPLSRQAARRTLGLSPDAFVAGWVGRLTRAKGPDVAIDALRLLRGLPVRLSVVGEGSEMAESRKLAEAAGVEDRIRWHGGVPSAGRLFSAFDVFVLTSRTEGTPVVLFEAMAAGVPIVATSVGGVPDVVTHEVEALLVPPEDSAAVARAVHRVYGEPAEARRRAHAARAKLRSAFGPEGWVARYDEVYRRVTGAPGPGREERA